MFSKAAGMQPSGRWHWWAIFIDSAIATGGIDILIEGNQNLTAASTGLEQVIGVKSLAIKSNPLLQDLNPLANLETVVEALEVQTNAGLGDCGIGAGVGLAGWRGPVCR